ncbi:MAG: pectinesterase family protein [Pseudomonadota bacterium]|nr:pectinesterase family protein [Pseudomonadota bacterium]
MEALQMIGKHTIAVMLCAAAALHAQAAPVAGGCPGGAGWCDDFENGAARWQAGGTATPLVRSESGTANHLLQAGAGTRLLVAAGETAALTRGDYFVEARLRPSATAVAPVNSRRAFLLARHIDERNWIGAGISYAPGSKRVTIELVAMRDGALVQLKKVGRDSEAADAFHTLRLELAGAALTVYLDGERVTGAAVPQQPGGQAGVLAEGGSVDIDDMRIGAALHPGRIALARMTGRVSAQAGDAAQRLPVSAFAGGGVTALPFAASSSDPAVASVGVDGGALVLRAHRPGSVVVTLVNPADHNLAAAIGVTVGPAFAAPALAHAPAQRLAPRPREAGVPVDTLLRIRFDGAAALGSGGSVRIFRAADNALVDVIRVGAEVDAIGFPGQPLQRVVRTTLIRIDGDGLTIRPHTARLAYGTDYYVAVDAGVVVGAQLGGQPFAGLGRQAGWRFRTRAAVPTLRSLTVDDDGPADFRTVQGALNHAMRTLPRAAPVTIRVANGRYEELLYLRGKDRVTLRGESRDGVVIHATNNDGINADSGSAQAADSPSASGGRALMLIEDADLLTLDSLTLVNTSRRAASAAPQAETLYFNSPEGRLVATNATFLSEQDTVQVKGYAWFYRTLIAGNVDFIWGYNHAALFEDSEIRSVGDSANPDSGGYVVQARTVAADDPGFVFLNSRLTHGPGPAGNDVPAGATYLARSPGTAGTWDNVSYIDCRIDVHMNPVGWAGAGVQRQPAPNPAVSSAASGWREYGSMDLAGRRLDLAARVGGVRLDAAQAGEQFGARAQVFRGFDHGKGWNPTPPANN